MHQFRIEAVGKKPSTWKMASKDEVEYKLKLLWWYCWGEE
jgi:hypothetical protein